MRIRAIEISDEVADVLRRSTWQGTTLILPAGQLDRKLYQAVDKIITTLGGKWNRSARGHVFGADASAELVAALERGKAVDQKKTFEQFFTPPALADKMAEALALGPDDLVLEPSAGSGRLIDAARKAGVSEHEIVAVEIDERLSASLASRYPNADVIPADFTEVLEFTRAPSAVIMNPPFSANQDIEHVRRAFDWLRPGGRLASIMSAHFTFAPDRASLAFRDWLTGLGGDVEILPDATFAESGTNVSAVLITVSKPALANA